MNLISACFGLNFQLSSMASLLQENARLEEVEKKREIRKATTGNAPISSENVVDKLLHEIRDGTTLRHRC